MTEPEKSGDAVEPGVVLPTWIDDAIARSRGEPAPSEGEPPPVETDVEPHGDLAGSGAGSHGASSVEPSAASVPVAETMDSLASGAQGMPHPGPGPERQPEATAAADRRASASRAAMPWIGAALFFAVAALIVAYLIWLRPPQE